MKLRFVRLTMYPAIYQIDLIVSNIVAIAPYEDNRTLVYTNGPRTFEVVESILEVKRLLKRALR